jgi:integrase
MADKAGTAPAPGLYRRNETWWGRVYVNGREYRRSLGTADPKAAEAALKTWREKLKAEAGGDYSRHRLSDAVVKWGEEWLPRNVKPAVARRYLVSAGQLLDAMGDGLIVEIDDAWIGRYITARSRTATNATIRRDLTALSRLMAAMIVWGWREGNPAKWYDRSVIRERREPMEPPTRAEIAAMIDAAPERMRPVLRLLAETGMRLDEAVTLRRKGVRDGAITLYRTKASRARRLPLVTPGGDARGILPSGGDYLFPAGPDGKPFANFSSNFGQLRTRLAREAREAGREPPRHWRIHDMRHAFAVRWLRSGGTIYALSKHLGHTSIKTTEIYLDHLTEHERERALRDGNTDD